MPYASHKAVHDGDERTNLLLFEESKEQSVEEQFMSKKFQIARSASG